MHDTDTVIIGAGQAGLAISRVLSEANHDHVVLERGHIGERWRSSTWDSLRLLTPNWMTRLPHWAYSGSEPDGYMRAAEVANFLDAYRGSFDAPVQSHTTVERVSADGSGFAVATNREVWRTSNVVIATGWCDRPAVPVMATRLHRSIEQITPYGYRNAREIPDGAVLIVGASATGVQLADELRRAGRPVYLAASRHTRVPRRYRGRDIYWWLNRIGLLDRRIEDVRAPDEAPREPSMQLIGRPDYANVDLPTLAAAGVVLLGRLGRIDGANAYFDDDLTRNMLRAEQRMCRVLRQIDQYITEHRMAEEQFPIELPMPPRPPRVVREMNLVDAGISTVIWATGFRRDYSWLDVPVLDAQGDLVHRGGITAAPGLYALGLRFQRTRRSNFLDGVGGDARFIAGQVLARKAG